jgi:hypothetical protein
MVYATTARVYTDEGKSKSIFIEEQPTNIVKNVGSIPLKNG